MLVYMRYIGGTYSTAVYMHGREAYTHSTEQQPQGLEPRSQAAPCSQAKDETQ